jgi:hypothetical protein
MILSVRPALLVQLNPRSWYTRSINWVWRDRPPREQVWERTGVVKTWESEVEPGHSELLHLTTSVCACACVWCIRVHVPVCMCMLVCTCVHVPVCVCVHTCACVHLCVHVCMYLWARVCTCICVHVPVCVCLCACVYVCTCLHLCACACVRMHGSVCLYVCVCACICVYFSFSLQGMAYQAKMTLGALRLGLGFWALFRVTVSF